MNTATVGKLAYLIFTSLWDIRELAVKEISKQLKIQIFQASERYNQNFLNRYGCIKTLGMWKPILLENIYIPAQFFEQATSLNDQGIFSLSEIYKQESQCFLEESQPCKDGVVLANQYQYLTILGSPGSGKSTFLRKIGIEALKDKGQTEYQPECIPVFVELKNKRIHNLPLDVLVAEEFRVCGFPNSTEFAQSALEKGKLLILLDGLDELPFSELNNTVLEIQNFVDQYYENRFILSTRPSIYKHNLRRFVDIQISHFDIKCIQTFILSWFRESPDIGDRCWEDLLNRNRFSTLALAQTPLFLTLICILYQRSGQLPINLATLYEKALRVLLEEWHAEKGLSFKNSLYQEIDTKRKEIILSEIAYFMFEEDRFFIDKKTLINMIEKNLNQMLSKDRLDRVFDGDTFLSDIEVQHGLICQRSEDVYSFSHLAIHEFLTAQYIAEDPKKIREVALLHANDLRWREVFILLAGLKKADELLLLLSKRIEKNITSAKVKRFLKWICEKGEMLAINSEVPAKRLLLLVSILELVAIFGGKTIPNRSLALGLDNIRKLLIAIEREIQIERFLDPHLIKTLSLELAIEIASNMASKFNVLKIMSSDKCDILRARLSALNTRISISDHPIYFKENCFRYIFHLYLEALNLPRELVHFSYQESQEIHQYISGLQLVYDCLKSAVHISTGIKEGIGKKVLCLADASHPLYGFDK